MDDPTYDRNEIDAHPVWELAFSMSEYENDNAPIGWSKYIPMSEFLHRRYQIARKDTE